MNIEETNARNLAVIGYYKEGHRISQCASKFGLSRQYVQQVLQKAGVWKRYVRTKRTEFLGITVSEETKQALKQHAEQKGVSVSQLASDALDAVVAADGESA